jgi:tetratricopeptide (TPR) repeat protein
MKGRMLVVLVAATIGAGCAQERQEECCPCTPGKVLDQELMLLLGMARAYHHQADIQLQQGQVDQAIATVRRILELDLSSKWPEAEEVRLDAVARLAKLLLGQGKEAEALAAVKQGITGAERESFYLSNLHGVQGEILEHRSKRLDAEGDKEGAKQVAREAIACFERSIAINKRLQRQLLKEGRR